MSKSDELLKLIKDYYIKDELECDEFLDDVIKEYFLACDDEFQDELKKRNSSYAEAFSEVLQETTHFIEAFKNACMSINLDSTNRIQILLYLISDICQFKSSHTEHQLLNFFKNTYNIPETYRLYVIMLSIVIFDGESMFVSDGNVEQLEMEKYQD